MRPYLTARFTNITAHDHAHTNDGHEHTKKPLHHGILCRGTCVVGSWHLHHFHLGLMHPRTAGGTHMLPHVSGTVHELQPAVGVQKLSLPGLISNARVLNNIATCETHDTTMYTRLKALLVLPSILPICQQVSQLGLCVMALGPRHDNLHFVQPGGIQKKAGTQCDAILMI